MLTILAAAAAAAAFVPPPLPARLGFSGAGQICGSQELRAELAARFARVVAEKEKADLYARCSESEA